MSLTHVHVTWTSGLYAGMNALTVMNAKPSADSAAQAKAFSRAIPKPRIPLHM